MARGSPIVQRSFVCVCVCVCLLNLVLGYVASELGPGHSSFRQLVFSWASLALGEVHLLCEKWRRYLQIALAGAQIINEMGTELTMTQDVSCRDDARLTESEPQNLPN